MKRLFCIFLFLGIFFSCTNDEEIPPIIEFPWYEIQEELQKEYSYVNVVHPSRGTESMYQYTFQTKEYTVFSGFKDNKITFFFYSPSVWYTDDFPEDSLKFEYKLETDITVPSEMYTGYGNTGKLQQIKIDNFNIYNNRIAFTYNAFYYDDHDEYHDRHLVIITNSVTKLNQKIGSTLISNELQLFFYYQDFTYLVKDFQFETLECYDAEGHNLGIYPTLSMNSTFPLSGPDIDKTYYHTYNSFIRSGKIGDDLLLSYIDTSLGNTETQCTLWTITLKTLKDKEKIKVNFIEFQGNIWEIQLDSIFWDGTKEQKTVKVDVTKGEIVK